MVVRFKVEDNGAAVVGECGRWLWTVREKKSEERVKEER